MARFFCGIFLFLILSLKLSHGHHCVRDAGEPLFLTPYLESGNISVAQQLARVSVTEYLRIESYAGYFTVNSTYDSNHFFWYFPPIVPDNYMAPVIVWLEGGPGASSVIGLFNEIGPLKINNNIFEINEYHWALNHHVIYIDNPVGAGFSFTNSSLGYCTDETQVGEQLHSTVVQFFILFPELQANELFVIGESYAGKYVTALSYIIHKMNPTADIQINLKGLAIGNGLIDLENQLVYTENFYQLGIIDWHQKKKVQELENEMKEYIQLKKWGLAFEAYNTLMYGNTINSKFTILTNITGFKSFENFLFPNYGMQEDLSLFLEDKCFRNSIHVGNQPFGRRDEVLEHLKEDMMQSVAPWISELLDHYRVLIYNGQLDLTVPYPSTVDSIRKFKFSGAQEYENVERVIWRVDGEIAGYAKQAGRLTEVMVRNSGHLVVRDQPEWTLDLITRFTYDRGFGDYGYE